MGRCRSLQETKGDLKRKREGKRERARKRSKQEQGQGLLVHAVIHKTNRRISKQHKNRKMASEEEWLEENDFGNHALPFLALCWAESLTCFVPLAYAVSLGV